MCSSVRGASLGEVGGGEQSALLCQVSTAVCWFIFFYGLETCSWWAIVVSGCQSSIMRALYHGDVLLLFARTFHITLFSLPIQKYFINVKKTQLT